MSEEKIEMEKMFDKGSSKENRIEVMFEQEFGKIKGIHGTNFGPLSLNGGIDFSEYFKKIQFPTVRLHDIPYFYNQAVDIPCVFPLFHLDCNDPRNYVFKQTDDYIQSTLDCGSEIIYRLGISMQSKYKYNMDPPADYDKWADICINIIRHYNEGWGNGFKHNIRYWEIWNEPRVRKGMWNASFEEFIRFYIQVSKRIKAACPNIMLGGPAFHGGMIKDQTILHTFLPEIIHAKAPLDFCSWHVYPVFPSQLVTAAKNVRKILDEYGLNKTESHLNEWSIAPYKGLWGAQSRDLHMCRLNDERVKGMFGAALVASSLIAMQDAPVDMANFYGSSYNQFGMFHLDGGTAKSFHSFRAFKKILDAAPNRVKVNGDDCDDGLAVLAGKSGDQSQKMILISNYQNPKCYWQVGISGLTEQPYKVQIDTIDNVRDLTLESEQTIPGPVAKLDVFVPPMSVRLLTIKSV